jgi:hypothetical protein
MVKLKAINLDVFQQTIAAAAIQPAQPTPAPALAAAAQPMMYHPQASAVPPHIQPHSRGHTPQQHVTPPPSASYGQPTPAYPSYANGAATRPPPAQLHYNEPPQASYAAPAPAEIPLPEPFNALPEDQKVRVYTRSGRCNAHAQCRPCFGAY